jgi:hypothetical protein
MKRIIMAMAILLYVRGLEAQVTVPNDRATVMIDGRYEDAEWQGAAKIVVNDSTSLYAKQDEDNIYLCLRTATVQPALVMVDLFLTQKGGLLNLHASAKLGERSWNGSSYGEWVWWNNSGWQATVARIDRIEERKFLRDEAKEFQLRKSRFRDKHFRLMMDISYPPSMVSKYPLAADTTDSKNWVQLKL